MSFELLLSGPFFHWLRDSLNRLQNRWDSPKKSRHFSNLHAPPHVNIFVLGPAVINTRTRKSRRGRSAVRRRCFCFSTLFKGKRPCTTWKRTPTDSCRSHRPSRSACTSKRESRGSTAWPSRTRRQRQSRYDACSAWSSCRAPLRPRLLFAPGAESDTC
jgi:hypothetical protein